MRYREYRRKCKDTKEKRLVSIAKYNYTVGAVRVKMKAEMKHKWDSNPDDGEPYDYFDRRWRGRRSTYLKKQYNRKLRKSSRLNMDLFGTTKSGYKRASGDFWWDYD